MTKHENPSRVTQHFKITTFTLTLSTKVNLMCNKNYLPISLITISILK